MAIDHVVVFGAGAIGSLYAAKLAAAADVTVVARPAHVDAINRGGLRVEGAEHFVARVRATARLDAVAPRTLILLTTKVNANREAAEALAPLVGDDTIVLCAQNGLDSERIVKTVFDERRARGAAVLRGIVQFGGIFRQPGVVDYKTRGHTLVERHARTGEIVDLFAVAGLEARVTDTIRTDVWRKLVFNCVINPITALMGTDVGSIADARLNPLKRLVIDECLAVARADGVVFDDDLLQALDRIFGPSPNTASMLQDLRQGRPTEIDHMNGAVVALGARHGLACPANAALTALVKGLEARTTAVR